MIIEDQPIHLVVAQDLDQEIHQEIHQEALVMILVQHLNVEIVVAADIVMAKGVAVDTLVIKVVMIIILEDLMLEIQEILVEDMMAIAEEATIVDEE